MLKIAEKLLELIKIILERYFIPALIAIPITILSVNLFTDSLRFLDTFTLTENYIFQYVFYLLILLLIFSIIRHFQDKYAVKHEFDEWDKEILETTINQIDGYSEEIRNIIKKIFYSGNQPIEIKTDFYGAQELQKILNGKATFSIKQEDVHQIIYMCRFTDSFFEKLQKLYKEKGCISHY